MCRYVSPMLFGVTIRRYVSPCVIRCRYMSLCVTPCYSMSLCVTVCHPMSLCLSRLVTLCLARCHATVTRCVIVSQMSVGERTTSQRRRSSTLHLQGDLDHLDSGDGLGRPSARRLQPTRVAVVVEPAEREPFRRGRKNPIPGVLRRRLRCCCRGRGSFDDRGGTARLDRLLGGVPHRCAHRTLRSCDDRLRPSLPARNGRNSHPSLATQHVRRRRWSGRSGDGRRWDRCRRSGRRSGSRTAEFHRQPGGARIANVQSLEHRLGSAQQQLQHPVVHQQSSVADATADTGAAGWRSYLSRFISKFYCLRFVNYCRMIIDHCLPSNVTYF